MNRNTANIFGVSINSGKYGQLLKEIISLASRQSKPVVIFTPNPAFILRSVNNPNFRRLLNQADINLPDGFGFILFRRLMGWKIEERVTGADMVLDLLSAGNIGGWRIGLVGLRGGNKEEADEQYRRLSDQYPQITFVYLDNSGDTGKQQYNLVLACQGMVKQEEWIWLNKDRYQAGVMMGVGGSLDFISGYVRRAPVLIQNIGLEWLWRVGQKPKHITRAVESLWGFSWLVIRNKILRFKDPKI